jgi:hypothetical protein
MKRVVIEKPVEEVGRIEMELNWIETKDGDSFARQLADRHYSRKTKGARLFVGPGEKLVMITPDYKALFVWRISRIRKDGQAGVECTIFRNEGNQLSSELIKEAVKRGRQRWPDEKRFFTYVKDSAVKGVNPGYCFKKAGWNYCGRNKNGKLTILELSV